MRNDQHEQGRIPPQATDIEAAVLGSMLVDPEAVPRAMEILKKDDFYRPTNQKLFDAMISLFEKSMPVDALTVTEELRRTGMLNAAEDPLYITELTRKITTSANIEYHARIVLEKSMMRNLISTSTDVAQRAFADSEDPLELLDDAQRQIYKVSERCIKKGFVPIREALHKTFEQLQSIHGKHDGLIGVTSGYKDLDNLTAGFQDSDLIIVAGRPSQGKTAFALAIARNAAMALHDKKAIAMFSLEMSEHQLVTRLIAATARVNSHQLRSGRLPEDEWKNISRSIGRLAEAEISIDDSSSLTVLEIRAKSRKLKTEKKIGMIIVDYMQLISGGKNNDSREQEISYISRSLKGLAKELNIPVIALSQLNRAVEARGDKRPVLSDLRESGAIEQDADVVMFVHRPEAYGLKEINIGDGNKITSDGMAEIIVAKQRNGPTDVVRLTFQKNYASFDNFSIDSYLPAPPESAKSEERMTPF